MGHEAPNAAHNATATHVRGIALADPGSCRNDVHAAQTQATRAPPTKRARQVPTAMEMADGDTSPPPRIRALITSISGVPEPGFGTTVTVGQNVSPVIAAAIPKHTREAASRGPQARSEFNTRPTLLVS